MSTLRRVAVALPVNPACVLETMNLYRAAISIWLNLWATAICPSTSYRCIIPVAAIAHREANATTTAPTVSVATKIPQMKGCACCMNPKASFSPIAN